MAKMRLFLLLLLLCLPQGGYSRVYCGPIPHTLYCPGYWVAAGNEMRCNCKENCLGGKTLKCLSNGNFEKTNFDSECSVTYEKWGFINKSITMKVSYSNNVFKLYCGEAETERTGTATCVAGEIAFNKLPVCAIPCTTLPSAVKCENTRHGSYLESRTCTCVETCRPATLICLSGGRWTNVTQHCSSSYTIQQNTVRISYTKEVKNFKVSCDLDDDKTLTQGSATCTRGVLSITKQPECGCTTKPLDYVKCGQNITKYEESTNCTCTETCRPVTITCDINGEWNNVSQLCNEPIARRSEDHVISKFNNGEYNFKCVADHQPIHGSTVALCENGQLNVTEESQLRCEPNKFEATSTATPVVLWASAGAAVLILLVILVIVAILCHRRRHGAAVVTEDIGFVTINDRREPVNPVPASPTSGDPGMEQNDLYAACNGPRDEEIEENEPFGAFDGAKNKQMEQNEMFGAYNAHKEQMDENEMYMNYNAPKDEQIDDTEMYANYTRR